MKCCYRRYAALILLIMGALIIPVSTFAEPEKAEAKPENAATVNGKTISYNEFENELALYMQRMQSQGMQIPEQLQGQVRTEVLDQIIGRELIYQESQKRGVKADLELVEQELSAIKKRFPDQKKFEEALGRMNLSEEKLKNQISERSVIRAFIEKEIISKIEVSDEEAKTFYEKNPNYFKRPEEVHAQHILIKSGKEDDDKKKTASRKELMEIKKRADAGEDFSELAKAHSQGPSAPKGGDLGYFSKGKMVPAFEKAAFELKPNEVSDIVETRFGFHLIKVIDHRQASTVSLEEARPKIIANLRNQKVQAEVGDYVKKLRGDAKIETFLK